jgi:cob(I)alamin adenosyltransferase
LGSDKKGLVHIYTGQGKGKTTASVGLAVRAAGCGTRVLFVQFFKMEDDPSGEKEIFRERIPLITLLRSNVRHPIFTKGRTDKAALKASIRGTFEAAKKEVTEGYGMLVFDEILSAINGGYINIDAVLELLDTRPTGLEVVLTGRDAPVELVKVADYVTEMLKIKHPFDHGVKAREGIEY